MTVPVRIKRFPLALSEVVRSPAKARSSQAAPARKVAAAAAPSRSHAATTATRASLTRTAAARVKPLLQTGLTSARVRARMVERLRAAGLSDARVIDAMAGVERHRFVDEGLAAQAYEEAALPIGHHQTISKPSTVARMIALVLPLGRPARVLEIGTGCGYQAAVLAHLAHEVYSIERVRALHERAKDNLRPLRLANVRLQYGDGSLGLPSIAPFEAIIIAAAGLSVPLALTEQLAIGGRLVAPIGGDTQELVLIERISATQWRESTHDPVYFVPLKSGVT